MEAKTIADNNNVTPKNQFANAAAETTVGIHCTYS